MAYNFNFTITGKVVNKDTQKGLSELKVEAYDRDFMSSHDFLGEATTDVEGDFSIPISTAQPDEHLFDKAIIVYFKIYDGDTLIKSTLNEPINDILNPKLQIVIPVDFPLEPGNGEDDPPLPDPVVEYQFYGRLVDDETMKPISNYMAKADDLEAGSDPVPLGYTFSNEQGLFALAFTTLANEDPPVTRRIKVIVHTPGGDKIHDEEITFQVGDMAVIDVSVTLPAISDPPSITIQELSRQTGLRLPAKLSEFLAVEGIQTLSDIVAKGGIANIPGLPVAPDYPAVITLDAHANLSTVSKDVLANEEMIKKGISNVHGMTKIPRSKFVTEFQPYLGDFNASQTQAVSAAQTNLAANLMTDIAVNMTNKFPQDDAREEIPVPDGSNRCGCKDCESAVSPLAYLVDLLDYCVTHLKNNGQLVNLEFLTSNLYQPLKTLPVSCEQMDTRVRQVRICTEILHSYLQENAPTPDQKKLLEQRVSEYLLTAYTTLLEKLGTTYEELRLARTAVDKVKENQGLAERVGVTLDEGEPDYLGMILLDPIAGEITEEKLEELFGFVDTTRNPLDKGTVPLLEKWRLENLRRNWREQDWPEIASGEERRPLIDPDLIDTADLRNPTAGDPAFDIWNSRWEEIKVLIADFKNKIASSADAMTGFELIVEEVIGESMVFLEDTVTATQDGEDVEKSLEDLVIPLNAATYLKRIYNLLKSGTTIIDAEWEAVYSILAQVKKLKNYVYWCEEEQLEGIFLGPDSFRLLDPLQTGIPSGPVALPEWRATFLERRDWEDKLSARIEQEKAAKQSLSDAVSETEAIVLPMLRDARIEATDATGSTLADKAKWITGKLFVDFLTSGCQETSRVSQAINSLQVLLFSTRTRQIEGEYPQLELDADAFDEEWKWIGSYGTWRSAMFAFLYPENILMPSFRRWQTPAFRKLVGDTRRNRRLNPEQASRAVGEYVTYFRDIVSLEPQATCQTRTRLVEEDELSHSEGGWRCLFYMFGQAARTKQTYWSVYDPEDGTGYAQSFWQTIPGMGDIKELIGAAPFEIDENERYIFLFGRRAKGGAQQLIYTRYDLENLKWDDEPQELELPDGVSSFSAVVKQNFFEINPPHIAIQTSNKSIYERRLNRDGTDWEDLTGDWLPTIGKLVGDKIGELCAMVEMTTGQYLMIARSDGGFIRYRVFGAGDDCLWRNLREGDFRGAFSWPDANDAFVFFGNDSLNFFQTIKLSDSILIEDKRGSFSTFNEWLVECTGVDLNKRVIDDDTEYSGNTYLEFLKLKEQNNSHKKRAEILFTHIQDQIENNENWLDWRIADIDVKRFAKNNGLVASLRSIYNGEAVLFQKRSSLPGEDGYRTIGLAGLSKIAPASGNIKNEAVRRVSYTNRSGNQGLFRTVLSRTGDEVIPKSPVRVAPHVKGPLDIFQKYSEEDLQLRRTQIEAVYKQNETGPASNFEYIQEAYYFVPIYIGLQLQGRKHFTEALDWYRTIYDFNMSKEYRKIYYGLVREESLANCYERIEDWLLDPLNPHAIAATRTKTYTRFTLISIIRCFLEYADSEFSRDTSESVPRARTLYTTAQELMDAEHLKLQSGMCSDLAGQLDIDIGDPKWKRWWDVLRAELATLDDEEELRRVTKEIVGAWAGSGSIEERFSEIRNHIDKAKKSPSSLGSPEDVLKKRTRHLEQAHEALLSSTTFKKPFQKAEQVVAKKYGNTVSMVTGIQIPVLQDKKTELPWMREPIQYQLSRMRPPTVERLRTDYLEVIVKNPVSPSNITKVSEHAMKFPASAVKAAGKWIGQYVPSPSFSFCIPTNPIIEALQLKAALNLYKIRTCRNIAGVERELDLYAAPTDTTSGLPVIGAGGRLNLPGTVTYVPTPYRYTVIVERAKQLVSLSQQIEAAFLSAIEKRDGEFYNRMKARQDLRMSKAGIRLQNLRVKVAEGEVKLSELQKDRAQLQADHYKNLLAEGMSEFEILNLGLLSVAVSLHVQSAALSVIAAALPSAITVGFGEVSTSYSPSGSLSSAASSMSSLAAASSTSASIMSTLASYERRAQEWQFQQSIASQDVKIGSQQVKISENRLQVVGQERNIAKMESDHAEETAEFLATKFTNVELYDWMADTLEGVYEFFLQQATAMAKLATSQLTFERQEPIPSFIQDDYWEVDEDGLSGIGTDEKPTDRRGITGSSRLLQDIYQLDQFAFETDKRKNQLTKNFSLSGFMPAEFQKFKQTGVLNFATPMELFDRDFPGDYLRLIKRVRISIIALIPAIESIKATLMTPGNSKVTTGGDIFQTVNLNRVTQHVSLTSPREATGLFELQPQLTDKLYPFEGMGVDAQWQFSLPKASNRFDFNSIADVIVTMEYTSLSSSIYRNQVIQTLGNKISADRPYSFRNELSDQWWELQDQAKAGAPLTVKFKTTESDFPPNIEDLKTEHIVLYFSFAEAEKVEVTVSDCQFVSKDAKYVFSEEKPVTSIGGVLSTRKNSMSNWMSTGKKSPIGEWSFSLEGLSFDMFQNEEITDILFVVTYSGITPSWPK